jgi:hypothetical protein
MVMALASAKGVCGAPLVEEMFVTSVCVTSLCFEKFLV